MRLHSLAAFRLHCKCLFNRHVLVGLAGQQCACIASSRCSRQATVWQTNAFKTGRQAERWYACLSAQAGCTHTLHDRKYLLGWAVVARVRAGCGSVELCWPGYLGASCWAPDWQCTPPAPASCAGWGDGLQADLQPAVQADDCCLVQQVRGQLGSRPSPQTAPSQLGSPVHCLARCSRGSAQKVVSTGRRWGVRGSADSMDVCRWIKVGSPAAELR